MTEINNSGYPLNIFSSSVTTVAGAFENSSNGAGENLPRLVVTEVPEPSTSALLVVSLLSALLRRS
ncbi:MAG: PEP-CTERM sorting domain-containing protein [Akkermansiaceae bacterium]